MHTNLDYSVKESVIHVTCLVHQKVLIQTEVQTHSALFLLHFLLTPVSSCSSFQPLLKPPSRLHRLPLAQNITNWLRAS